MDAFVLIDWDGDVPALSRPATVGLAWRLEELDDPDDNSGGFTSERELYERGWRWCECYSPWCLDGERRFVGVDSLAPLRPVEFDVARAALARDVREYERVVEALHGPATRRWE
jgi:hypothetical protein